MEIVEPIERSRFRRLCGAIAWTIRGTFCLVSWLALMGLLTAAPLLQILAFGYLLRVSGHLAAGGKLRNCIEHLDRAGKIGLAVCIVFLAAAPSQLFAHYESLASIVNPGSQNAATMRQLAIFSAAIAFLYLVWAWARGGELWQYVWPQPRRAIAEIWRPSFWNSAIDRLWELIVSLQIPSTFWLVLAECWVLWFGCCPQSS